MPFESKVYNYNDDELKKFYLTKKLNPALK